mgnify:FL=1
MDRPTLNFEGISVGDELPPLKKQITAARIMAYGAATWDFIRIHYDADYVRGLGFDGPFLDGQMMGGFLAQQVQDWAGPGAFLRKLSFSNRGMTYPGDLIICHGIVTGKSAENGEELVTCDLWAVNQSGEKVVQPASALVRFSARI